MTFVEGAADAIRRGLPVFRLQPSSKRPYTGTHGCKDATRDSEQVRAWWAAQPDSNVGIGGLGDHIIIDCDGGCATLADAREFARERDLPPTLTIRTGNHTSYRFQMHYSGSTANLEYREQTIHGEIRCQGEYGLFPPSIHPDSGLEYEIAVDLPVALWREEYRRGFTAGMRESIRLTGADDTIYDIESARESYQRRLYAVRNAVKGGRNSAANSVTWFAARANLAHVFEEYSVCGVVVLPGFSEREIKLQIADAVEPLYRGDYRDWRKMLRDSWRYGLKHGPLDLELYPSDYLMLQRLSDDDRFQSCFDGNVSDFQSAAEGKRYMERVLTEAGAKDVQRVLRASRIFEAVASELLFNLKVSQIISGTGS